MRQTSLTALVLTGGLCASAGALAADTAASEKDAAPASSTSAPSAPATSPPAPAPAADSPLVRLYGTVNTRVVASTGATESFSQPNGVAVTAAGNPVFSVSPDKARYTFQAAQSRFGLWVNEKGPLRGQLEFDFVDFTKASPTVASLPRLRIARADWLVAPGHMLSLGQDWDLHAPINPHGINMVGNLFMAGNTGFMRQQLRYLYSTDALELGVAVGFPFNNNTNKESAAEISTAPTLAARAAYKFGKSRVGVSGITTELPFNVGAPSERRVRAFGTALFADLNPLPTTNVRAELNYDQDGANLGLLSLAQGGAAGDLHEMGGFVSVRQALADRHAVYGMVGTQRVLDAGVAPSYAYPTGGTDPASVALAGTGPGIIRNTTARVGYEFKPIPSVSVALEGFTFRTTHALQQVDLARGVNPTQQTYGLEAGALLTF
jgi:hypothetical protein